MLRLTAWNQLPDNMKNKDVISYYESLKSKKRQLVLKRMFDVVVGICIAIVLSPVMLIISILIKMDSKGPVMFKQERVTTNGRIFRIYKFRTMVVNAESIGTQVTTKSDSRITRMGKILRKVRLDELPQIFNVIIGDMSFVGTRPEVPRYVAEYTDEMMATLLMPAGITSEASINYKDEERLLTDSENADYTYINEVLPEKMRYNLGYIVNFSVVHDLKVMINTVIAVLKKDSEKEEVKDIEHKDCQIRIES